MQQARLVIITGLSGSGKTTAARALEDEGFFVVDNLPLVLLPAFLELNPPLGTSNSNLAVVVDVRNQQYLQDCQEVLSRIKEAGHQVDIFFFDANDDALLRRYSETRRRHPLPTRQGVAESILCERELLVGLMAMATAIIDTSWMTPHQLRAKTLQLVYGDEGGHPLAVLVQSFGFRYGIPPGADLVMDVRFLPNPHFIPELRPSTGLAPAVRDFVLEQAVTLDFLDKFLPMLEFLLPHYRQEGKSYLTIAIGCTGGRHRSVAIAEHLRSRIRSNELSVEVLHRDVAKG